VTAQIIVGDLRTGRRIIPIPARSGDWEIRRNRAGSLSCDVTLSSKAHRRLDLAQNAAEGRTFLAVVDGDRVFEAGPIWEHDYDDDTRRLTLTGEGMWSLLSRRFILPTAVETVSLLLTSGDDAGKPNPDVATTFAGETWPQIVKGILQQGFARAGGSLPIVFGPDGVGAHDKSYDSASFKAQGEALTDLTELVDGPEIEFRSQWTSDGLGVEWVAVVGDDAQPSIFGSGLPHRFDFSVPKRSVRALKVRSSARALVSEQWETGGRQAAVALIARAASDILVDAGYPRMEAVSSAHSTVLEQATLDSYAGYDLKYGGAPTRWWSFESNMDAVPKMSSMWLGDYCDVTVRDNPYLGTGTFRRRIAAMRGSLGSRWVQITTDEVSGW